MSRLRVENQLRVDGVEVERFCENCGIGSTKAKWGVTRDGKPLAYLCRECWKKRYAATIKRNRERWKLIDKATRRGMTVEEFLEVTQDA